MVQIESGLSKINRIVDCFFDEHLSLRNLAEIESVSLGTLFNWGSKYTELGEEGLVDKNKGNPFADLHTSKSLSEIARLKLEVLKRTLKSPD